MIGISVLGSGSRGNSVLLTTDRVRVLVDVGLSGKQIGLRLAALGYAIGDLDAILLTHEHLDHSRGLDVVLRGHGVPVYCNAMTQRVVGERMRAKVAWRLVETGREFMIGDLRVHSFSVPHDAVDPMAFTFECGGARVGVLIDLGHVTAGLAEMVRGVHTLFVEANYDEAMLVSDSRRPWPVKQRISSRHGHLSNDQCAALVADLAGSGLRRVILGHLSRDCNSPEVAATAVRAQCNGAVVEIHCAGQDEPIGHFEVPAGR